MIKLAALILSLAGPAWAINPDEGVSISTAAGTATLNISGSMGLAASSVTFATYTITLNGVNGAVTATSFAGSGAALTGIPMSSSATYATSAGSALTSSTAAYANNVPASGVLAGVLGSSVIASSIAVNSVQLPSAGSSVVWGGTITANSAQFIATTSGTASNPLALNSSSVTLQGNTFNGNSQLVQLTGGGLYPALNGSLITNLVGVTQWLSGPLSSIYYSAGSVALGTGTAQAAFDVERDSSGPNGYLQLQTVAQHDPELSAVFTSSGATAQYQIGNLFSIGNSLFAIAFSTDGQKNLYQGGVATLQVPLSGQYVELNAAGGAAMYLYGAVGTYAGRVGIGTSTPSSTLAVNGTVTVSTSFILSNGSNGDILCVDSSHKVGHCTSAASCLSGCTCTCSGY